MCKEYCEKCGGPWEIHEFAVPVPYCPSKDEIIAHLKAKREVLENVLSIAKYTLERVEYYSDGTLRSAPLEDDIERVVKMCEEVGIQ